MYAPVDFEGVGLENILTHLVRISSLIDIFVCTNNNKKSKRKKIKLNSIH